jgi:hypothetical protein
MAWYGKEPSQGEIELNEQRKARDKLRSEVERNKSREGNYGAMITRGPQSSGLGSGQRGSSFRK